MPQKPCNLFLTTKTVTLHLKSVPFHHPPQNQKILTWYWEIKSTQSLAACHSRQDK